MIRHCIKVIIFGGFFSALCCAVPMRVTVNQASFNPTPIAIVPFTSPSGLESIGNDITQVISEDLASSNLFKILPQSIFIQDYQSIKTGGVRFNDWRVTGAHCLLTGSIIADSDKIQVEFYLYDVINGQTLFSYSIKADQKKWRKLSHMIADAIYSRITSETGYFDTQVLFIDEAGSKQKRIKSLVLMDRDGYNPRRLTDGKNMVITPRFSPTGKEVAYISFDKGVANIHLMNLETKASRNLGKFEGLNFAPRFSPDGSTVVMSLTKAGLTAIYTMNLQSGQLTQLTPHVSIDTSPCFSPDGKNIVFTSDRGGFEQIYLMDSNGQNVKRISFGEGTYSQPVYSPRGDMIAFTKKVKGLFYIGVMDKDGNNERLIAQGYLVEAPVWSPNGRLLMFTKETAPSRKGTGSTSRLYTVDLTGYSLQQIKTPRDASDGAWSPLLGAIPVK